jgi:alkanesulfonate monooxygenase SsuD/methylene tetrahydromethanopterin reductase-like flavin-dependent oxidoreductase (luciferase family)
VTSSAARSARRARDVTGNATKAINAAANAGTFFSIRRKLVGEDGFTLIGNTGEKFFTDATLLQGTPDDVADRLAELLVAPPR